MSNYHSAQLKDLLGQLEAARKAALKEHRERSKQRAPLAAAVRDLKGKLSRSQKTRTKMRTWSNFDDFACERIHGQQWRDDTARIATYTSQLLDAEIALALFDKDNP